MIYELDTIPLGRFIDVYLGDASKAVEGEYSEAEQREAAERMCDAYMSIVGGKSLASLIVRRHQALKIQMRGSCLSLCKMFVEGGDLATACAIMLNLGYRVEADKQKLLRKIDVVLSSDAYQLSKFSDKKEGEPLTRDHFIRERVAVMSHLKMYIDEAVFKAKEYAYLVKQVHDEIDSMMKSVKR